MSLGLHHRRRFLRSMGFSAAALPFLTGLPSFAAKGPAKGKQRVVVMFSPNGTIPGDFWPSQPGSNYEVPEILRPLEKHRDRMLILQGISNRVRGDGDNHMRGMSCLLTGIELFPGNIQGGSDTPAGWAKGISIDQELKNYFQSKESTQTRFGSLEFGVGVTDRADPWTRMSYAGPNLPVAPISDPYEMYKKLYGQSQERKNLTGVLDHLRSDLKRARAMVSTEDRRLLDQHETLVRQMEREIALSHKQKLSSPPPTFSEGVADQNDNVPRLSRMQIDLLVNSFANDMARVATLQYTKSVGQAKMGWLDISDAHHSLSHEPDSDEKSKEKLVKINRWFAGELNYLIERLAQTPEPGMTGSMLDHTTVVWTNELGKGNSHTLDNIPFVFIGGGLGFKMGRAMKFDKVPHNRLHLALAHAVGHRITTFGNPRLSEGGPLDLG